MPRLVPQEPVRPMVVQDRPEPVAEPIVRYRVLQERRIMHRGSMTLLRQGKVVDERNYNVRDLMGQGVELQEV